MPEALTALGVIGILLIVGWLKERRGSRQPVRYAVPVTMVGGERVYLYDEDEEAFVFVRNRVSNCE